MSRFYHTRHCALGHTINWSKAPVIYLTIAEFDEKLKSMDPALRVKGNKSATLYRDWKERGSWRLVYDNSRSIHKADLRYHVKPLGLGYGPFVVYRCNLTDDEKNTDAQKQLFGSNAYAAVVKEGKSEDPQFDMEDYFGKVGREIRDCVPRSFYYANNFWMKRKIIASYVDFCSQFPTNLCGLLPDAHTAKRVEGEVDANKEYPFAFYPHCGASMEVNPETGEEIYDTREWVNTDLAFGCCNDLLYNWRFKKYNTTVKPYTILMKASAHELTGIMQHFYALRHEDPSAKAVMNKFIGFLHQTKSEKGYNQSPNAHLAAVSIARSTQKMLNLAFKVGVNKIVQIAIDGMIYIGRNVYGVKEKKLGNLHQNVVGKIFFGRGTGCYVFMDEGGKIVDLKHQGYNVYNTDIKDPAEILKWYNDNSLMRRLESIMAAQEEELCQEVNKDCLKELI